MKKITISVTFNESGHGNINIVPTNYGQWNPVYSSSNDYMLTTGSYIVTYLTATKKGGLITITEDGELLAQGTLKEGVDGDTFLITVK